MAVMEIDTPAQGKGPDLSVRAGLPLFGQAGFDNLVCLPVADQAFEYVGTDLPGIQAAGFSGIYTGGIRKAEIDDGIILGRHQKKT